MESLSRDEVGAVLGLVADDLERVEKIIQEASSGRTTFVTETATHLANAGGKRLRPALASISARLAHGSSDDVHKAGAAIEMTHLATLYHDDVIDESGLRRGVPSVNEKWGNHVAILAGDYLFARSSGLASEVGGEVPGILADAVAKVVVGQLTELTSIYDPQRSIDHYPSTIEGKTAALLQAAAQIGARLGGCDDEQVADLKMFGFHFGMAFQIADDLLDLSADAADTGKQPGTDLKDGVYTLPVILLVSHDPSFHQALGTPEVDVEAVTDRLITSGMFQQARRRAWSEAETALGYLSRTVDGEAKTALKDLTHLIIDRVPEPDGGSGG